MLQTNLAAAKVFLMKQEQRRYNIIKLYLWQAKNLKTNEPNFQICI